MMTNVYADNAATTKMCDTALNIMKEQLENGFYNPSSLYKGGMLERGVLNDARRTIAKTLGAFDREIIFTSGGSEADNLALIGFMEANCDKGRHLITTGIEHHAVMESCKYLEKRGFKVTYLPVLENGLINISMLKEAITPDTILVSVMTVNNEVGTVEPIEEIGKVCKEHDIVFHTDAVQAYGKMDIDVQKCNIGMLSASAHKFNGPKGAGFLYKRRDVRLQPFLHGGSQEYGLRAGTENAPAIAAMAAAADYSFEKLCEQKRIRELRNHLLNRLNTEIEGIVINTDITVSNDSILNVSFPDLEGQSLLISLDMKGICASTGSACAIADEEPSHVLLAMKRSHDEAKGSVRFSFSHENTLEEVDYIADSLKDIVEYLRRLKHL